MAKKKRISRLLAAVSLSCCMLLNGCGGGERVKPSPEQAKLQLPQAATEHNAALTELQKAWDSNSDQSGSTFRLYYDDTQSILGFVRGSNGENCFNYLLENAISAANSLVNLPRDGVSAIEAYTLSDGAPNDKKHQELNWTMIDMSGSLRGNFRSPAFYTGSHEDGREGTLQHTYPDGTQRSTGPLARLFLDGNTPFTADGITVLVSDLQEQGFDLHTLSSGLLDYCKKVPAAKVCIVSALSDYEGQLSVPVFSISDTGSDIASIQDFSGSVPFYYIIAGPANLVDNYCASLQQGAEKYADELQFTYFSNPDASYHEPLYFELAPNTMSMVTASDLANGTYEGAPAEESTSDKKTSGRGGRSASARNTSAETEKNTASDVPAAANARGRGESASNNLDQVWGSANLTSLTAADALSNVFVASTGSGKGACRAFGRSVLISAYADIAPELQAGLAVNGAAPADGTYWIDPDAIQFFNYANGQLTPADRNTLGCIDVRFETKDGALAEYPTGQSLLSGNRHTAYLRVMIDATPAEEGGILDVGSTYYVSIPVHTHLKASAVDTTTALENMAADLSMHREALNGLAASGSGYSWTASSDDARAAAAVQFAKTPKLDEFVTSLANYFESGDPDADVQYVDIMLTINEIASGRS